MKVKSPYDATATIDLDATKCSKVVPNDQGVLKTGYRAVCPKTGKPFEAQLSITAAGTDKQVAVATGVPLSEAAVRAEQQNALVDKAVEAAQPDIDAKVKTAVAAVKGKVPDAVLPMVEHEVAKEARIAVIAETVKKFQAPFIEAAKQKQAADLKAAAAAIAKVK